MSWLMIVVSRLYSESALNISSVPIPRDFGEIFGITASRIIFKKMIELT
jgi:hypothetical protein